MMNRLFFIIVLIISISFSCKKEEKIDVDEIRLYRYENPINVGDSVFIIFHISPENADYSNLIWNSSNSEVAGINGSTGMVTGLSAGNSVISVRTVDGKISDSCTVSVLEWIYFDVTDNKSFPYVNKVAIDNDNNKWFGTEKGLFKYDNTDWTQYTEEDGLPGNRVYSIAFDNSGNHWFGTDGGLAELKDGVWTSFTTDDGLAGNMVYDIKIDSQDNLWVGTGSGVSKFDGTNWTNYTSYDGLASNYVQAVEIDAGGNIWCGTISGISMFNGSVWKSFSSVAGMGFCIFSIASDSQNNIWFGTYQFGLYKFNGTDTDYYYTGSDSNSVLEVKINDQGNVWVGTTSGFLIFDGSTWQKYDFADQWESNIFYSIAFESEKEVWFGAGNGAYKLIDF